jgi:glucose/arabinose dehydrogenase
MNTRWIGLWVLVCLIGAMSPALAVKSKVEDLYRENCASCHGAAMDGGMGGSLADGAWKYGESDGAIAAAISNGIPDAGMPAFKETLSPEEIRSLVVFIREKETAAHRSSAPKRTLSPGEPLQTMYANHLVETVVSSGLETPWALAFLPDGRKLVTERSGRLRILDSNWNLLPEPVEGTPDVVQNGQGGMLDVAPAPDYESTGWIYLSYSAPAPGESPDAKSSMTKVSRGRLSGNRWVDEQTIYEAKPGDYSKGGVHFGSRIAFADGHVFISIGDRGVPEKAQDPALPNGKILRLLPDGGIPGDNPFVGREDALDAVWSWGHRNPQGLAVDTKNGGIYSTEHGPRGGDEFNHIRKGANYGWPLVSFGMNYNGTPVTALTEKEGIEAPLHHWTPSIATCGLAFYDGERFPEWKHDFFAGGLRGELHRLRLRNGKIIEDEVVLDGAGRVRDVRCGPDGFLYVVLNAPDRIVRLVPAVPGSGKVK